MTNTCVTCDQCEILRINGTICHETGCPNERRTWNADACEWVRVYRCAECDSVHDDAADAAICCQEEYWADADEYEENE